MSEASKSKKAFQIISRCLYGLLALLCIYLIVGSVYGKVKNEKFFVFNKYSFEIVLTNSMEPAIKTGSLVIVEKCQINDVKIGDDGDVVCFKATKGHIKGNNVLHRAVGSYENENGEFCLYTKGDNNMAIDQKTDSMGQVSSQNFYGKAVFASIFLGSILGFLKNPVNLIFIAAIIVILYFVKKAVCNLIKISKEQNGKGDK